MKPGLVSGLIGGLAWFCWPYDDAPTWTIWAKVAGAALTLIGFIVVMCYWF